MKLSDSQIDKFDRNQQITALNIILDFLKKVDRSVAKYKEANQKIVDLTAETEKMKKGVSAAVIAICSITAFIFLLFFAGFNSAVTLVVICLATYFVVDITYLSKNRKARAAEFYNQSFSALTDEKAAAEAELIEIQNSDDTYNANLLLPDEYISIEKVQSLLDLLNQRRARTISEAIILYEQMVHQEKLENIELERLKAAQEAAEAQKKDSCYG